MSHIQVVAHIQVAEHVQVVVHSRRVTRIQVVAPAQAKSRVLRARNNRTKTTTHMTTQSDHNVATDTATITRAGEHIRESMPNASSTVSGNNNMLTNMLINMSGDKVDTTDVQGHMNTIIDINNNV